MEDNDKAIHIEDDDAMAAEKTGVMRYVLGVSLILAIIAMSIVWLIPAMTEGDVEGAKTATDRVQEMREDGVAEEDIPAKPSDYGESDLEDPTAEALD